MAGIYVCGVVEEHCHLGGYLCGMAEHSFYVSDDRDKPLVEGFHLPCIGGWQSPSWRATARPRLDVTRCVPGRDRHAPAAPHALTLTHTKINTKDKHTEWPQVRAIALETTLLSCVNCPRTRHRILAYLLDMGLKTENRTNNFGIEVSGRKIVYSPSKWWTLIPKPTLRDFLPLKRPKWMWPVEFGRISKVVSELILFWTAFASIQYFVLIAAAIRAIAKQQPKNVKNTIPLFNIFILKLVPLHSLRPKKTHTLIRAFTRTTQDGP